MRAFLFMLVLSLLVQWVMPWWWSFAVVVFAVAATLRVPAGRAFVAGFAAVFVLWALAAAVQDLRNDGILSGRMAVAFGLPGGWALLLVTALVGGLVGGLAGWAGAEFRRVVRPAV